MAGEPILILESDPTHETRLNDVLSADGYRVYAAESAESVVSAVGATAFALLVVDVDATDDPVALARQCRALQPDMALVLTRPEGDAAPSWLRAGAVDVLERPYDDDVIRERIGDAVERSVSRVETLAHWRERALHAESAAAAAIDGQSADANRFGQVGEFADYALDKFLELERRNAELERQLRRLTNQSDEPRPPITTWIAHSDAEFAAGVSSLGPRLNLLIAAPMSTGGEVLDRMSAGPPGILIVDSNLPDIPSSLVLQTVHSEHPNVQVVIVDGWGTNDRSVTLHGEGSSDVERTMETVQDLLEVVQLAAERASDTALGRDFAVEFKARHEEFLRRYASVKRAANR